MIMKILVLNCGSSSVKFQLIQTDLERIKNESESVLARGMVEKIGVPPAVFHYQVLNENPILLPQKKDGLPPAQTRELDVSDHRGAIGVILKALTDAEGGVVGSPQEIDAVGHRVVHGGELFKTPVVFDEDVVDGVKKCSDFAPLHNPPNLEGYLSSKDLLAHCPHVAVFDTAFHQSMPAKAYLYALPYSVYENHGIRRYGFHGVSHRYVTYRCEQLTKTPREEMKLITCHLGNGCSITAVNGGKSSDTSMGFTPLEGLVMGTRTGDFDASILLTLMEKEGLGAAELNKLVNKQSGLLGVSGVSSDMREVQKAAGDGNERAALAVDIFCYRIKKYIAAYAGVLGGADHVIFTGGIGENSAVVREKSCEGLSFMGIELDAETNAGCRGREGLISNKGASTGVWVIPTNEELVFARDTARCLSGVESK